MAFFIRPMDQTGVMEIVSWTYEAPYDLYNVEATAESIYELLNGSYWLVASSSGQIIGFYCVGKAAQVSSGHHLRAYESPGLDVIDIGIGMRPDLTGQGRGALFLDQILKDVAAHYHPDRMRLTVATFNKRAIKLYRDFGFQAGMRFEHNGVMFQTMENQMGKRFSTKSGDCE